MTHVPRNPRRILIVDDDDATRVVTQVLVRAAGYDVETAADGIEGLAKIHLGIDLVLLDLVMPGMDGFEVCRRLRSDAIGADIPVIMLTSMASRDDRLAAVEAGANDFIAKPVEETEFRIRAASLLKLKDAQDSLKGQQAHLEELVRQRTASLRAALEQMAEAQRLQYLAQLDTVERLAIVAEYKDRVTAQHIERISHYCAILARALKLPPGEVELIQHASRMHDLGKIAVPDVILRKPTHLDPPEWLVMREHAGDRRPDSRELELGAAAGGARHRAQPPRTVGWHRLSVRSCRRGHSAVGTDLRRRRHVRCGHERALVQAGLLERRGARDSEGRPRHAVRPEDRRRVL